MFTPLPRSVARRTLWGFSVLCLLEWTARGSQQLLHTLIVFEIYDRITATRLTEAKG